MSRFPVYFIAILLVAAMIVGGIFYTNAFRSDADTEPGGTLIKGEAVSLFGTESRSLFYPILKVRSVYSYDANTGARVDFSPDDYQVIDGQIARTAQSSIYDFNNYHVITDDNGKYELVTTPPRNPPPTMNLLAYVDYDTADVVPEITIPGLAPFKLTGKIVAAGDSITGGANTISREFFDSDRDGYVGLLRDHFRNQFDVENFSFNGSTIGQLTSGLSEILADEPSALTIAFGQNDHVNGPSGLQSFKDALTDIVNTSQSEGVYVVLVGFFRKNPNWINFSLSDAIAYNEAIEEVATATGAAFVDIDARWEAMKAAGKTHLDLTGDNHHHPNNYGARVYFSAILPHLLSSPVSSSEVTNYIVMP